MGDEFSDGGAIGRRGQLIATARQWRDLAQSVRSLAEATPDAVSRIMRDYAAELERQAGEMQRRASERDDEELAAEKIG